VGEPGFNRTSIFDRFLAPDDHERVADYGTGAEYAGRVRGVYDVIASAPETPGPDEVVETFLRLIEAPAGDRPFRTVSSPAMQRLLDLYNAAAAEIRPAVAHMFQVRELITLQRSAWTGE